ncbi:MAG: NADH-quinone oxidoreductase subunit NuoE [Acidobacteria bacterium]|nr:NADH-quinone oxidoreductase subunit NuoE [Acidobacteriota bacterium]MCI0628153.1 NADH-quinone oxidoreductase subunit NuoE [Acidobacteriota bacterium]
MISDQLLARFASIVQNYPVKRSALIPILLTTQEELGYLSADCIGTIARFLELPEIEVHEVVTFYSMLRTKPAGKHHVQVCTNISCLLLGGEEIFAHVSKRLGIKEGETTSDGQFSLTEVECLGACCNAPAMQVNYAYHEDLTFDKVDQILQDLKNQP